MGVEGAEEEEETTSRRMVLGATTKEKYPLHTLIVWAVKGFSLLTHTRISIDVLKALVTLALMIAISPTLGR